MSSNPPVKLKWTEHLNASWVVEDTEALAGREDVTRLYDRLLQSQEVVMMPQQVLHLKVCSLIVQINIYILHIVDQINFYINVLVYS